MNQKSKRLLGATATILGGLVCLYVVALVVLFVVDYLLPHR